MPSGCHHTDRVLPVRLAGWGCTAAVVLWVCVRVPALGPLPELYEAGSALPWAVAAVLAAVLLGRRRSGRVP